MWEWFSNDAVWVLIGAAIGHVAFLFVHHHINEHFEKTLPKSRSRVFHMTMRAVFWLVGGVWLAVTGLALAALALSQKGAVVISTEIIQRWLLEHGIVIVVIVVSSYLGYRLLKVVIPEVVERSVRVRGKGRSAQEEMAKRSHTLSSILTGVAGSFIAVTAVFIILADVNINIAPLLAGAGVLGVALGFGAQSMIRDYLNGLFILLEDQYNKGDVVQIAGISGQVEEVNLRRTVLRDLDGVVHTIPNGQVSTSSNYTKDYSRVNLNIQVGYNEDLDRVTAVIDHVGQQLADDAHFGPMMISKLKALRVDKLGDLGVEIKVIGETKPLKQWEVAGEFRRRIKKAFDEEKIEIPSSQMRLYLEGPQLKPDVICAACSHPNLRGSRFCSGCGAGLPQA